MEFLEQVQLVDEEDELFWALERSGKFSTKFLYKLKTNSGEVDMRMKELWEEKLPLKINIFLWMLWHYRVQIRE
jgi:hypothetical protein